VALAPMSGSQDFFVRTVFDATEFDAGIANMQKGAKTASVNIQQLGRSFIQFSTYATAAIGAIGFKAFSAARDAEAAGRKFAAVFGDTAKETMRWAEDMGDRFGVTNDEMQRFLSQSQDLFVPMGMARTEAAMMSKTVAELGLKLAIFNGQPTEQVLQNIQSGLVGMSRPMRQYGVMLTEARVAQEAVNMGMAQSTKEVSELAKIQARLNLMLQDSGDAWNKAESMMDGAVGAQERIGKAIRETWNELGNALVPIVLEYTDDIVDMAKATAEWVKANQPLIETIVKLTVRLAELAIAIKAIGTASAAVKGLGALGSLLGAGGTAALGAAQKMALAQAVSTQLGSGAAGASSGFVGTGASGIMSGIAGATGTSAAATGIAAAGPLALLAGGAYVYHKQTQALARAAEFEIENADRKIEQITKERFKRWRDESYTAVTGTMQDMLEAVLEVDLTLGDQKAGVFAERLLESIREAGPEAEDELTTLMSNLAAVSGKHTSDVIDPIMSALQAQLETFAKAEEEMARKRVTEHQKAVAEQLKADEQYLQDRLAKVKTEITKEQQAYAAARSAEDQARMTRTDRLLGRQQEEFERQREEIRQGRGPATMSEWDRIERLKQGIESGQRPSGYQAGPATTEQELLQRRALELEELARNFADNGDLERATQLAQQAKQVWEEWFDLGPTKGKTLEETTKQLAEEMERINSLQDTWDTQKIEEARKAWDDARNSIEKLQESQEAIQGQIDKVADLQKMAAQLVTDLGKTHELKISTSAAESALKRIRKELDEIENGLDKHRERQRRLDLGHGE